MQQNQNKQMVEQKKTENPLGAVKAGRAIIPIVIGLGYVFYMLYREYDPEVLGVLKPTTITYWFLSLAFLLMIIRDVGYVIRIKILTGGELTWMQSIRVILLWEFTSAVTPSAIGGTGVAILYVNKEGVSVGKSSAVVMATSFLDELYFILMFPLLILLVGVDQLFIVDGTGGHFPNSFFWFALIGYSVKFIYTCFISYGLFFNPRGLKWLLLWIFRLPFLRRWRHGADEAGTDIILSSKELKSKPFMFWFKTFLATALSWTSRYWVVNAMLLAFLVVPDHFAIFARQLVMWIMMLVSPTPGGSGFAEFVFTRYLSDFIVVEAHLVPVVTVAMALLWRFISYYPYLFIGAIMLPGWVNKHFLVKKKEKRVKDQTQK